MKVKLLCATFFFFSVSAIFGQEDTTFTIRKLKVLEVSRESAEKSTPVLSQSTTTSLSTSMSSPEIGETPGNLSVSPTGGAIYSVPIKVPPGIAGIEPEISLTYNSQGGNGLAGYGWNISGISVITRIPKTNYHDGFSEGVNLDNSDRFSFDGQRLLLKSGTYGGSGAVYQTENYSNIKIESFNSFYSGPTYFKVSYPDGSVAYYGKVAGSRSAMDYAISYWENSQGIRISYEYTSSYNSLRISKIKYGSKGSATPINEIQFVYSDRKRVEQAYIAGSITAQNKILSEIKVLGNGIGFRNYQLDHDYNSLGYERLISITEKNGNGTLSFNPINFTYITTTSGIDKLYVTADLGLSNIEQRNSIATSFDLDGSGIMDFTIHPKSASERTKFWLFEDVQDSGNYMYIPYEVSIGRFEKLFPATWLTYSNKLLPGQGIVAIQNSGSTNVNFRMLGHSSYSGLAQQYTKTWAAPTFTNENNCDLPGIPQRIPQEYISGDFNGDGLTDIIAIGKSYFQRSCFPVLTMPGEPCGFENDPILQNIEANEGGTMGPETESQNEVNYIEPIDGDCCRCESGSRNTSRVHLIDLKRNLTTGFVTSIGYLQSYLKSSDRLLTGDVNGDGKTDILQLAEGKISVYTIGSGNGLELLFSTSDSNLTVDFPVLPGDYNGDGKLDLMFPTADNSRYFAMFLSTGKGFSKSLRTQSFTYKPSNWEVYDGVGTMYGYHLIPSDINGDGKTDIIDYRTETRNDGTSGIQTVQTFKNTYSSSSSGLPAFGGDSYAYLPGDLKHFPIPIFLNSEKNNRNLDFASISDNKITSFKFNQDSREDMLLRGIVKNGVTHSIKYAELSPENSDPDIGQVYQPTLEEEFPNHDIKYARGFKVVGRLERSGIGLTTLKKSFSYYGAVSNFEGLGFRGFKGIASSNWHTGYNDQIWNVAMHDLSKRGAVTMDYTTTNYVSFHSAPTDFIIKNNYTYETSLLGNKVFKLKLLSSLTQDALRSTNINKTFVYDEYNNPKKVITNFAAQGEEIVEIDYDNSTSTNYYIGRPTRKKTTSKIGLESFVSEETYIYSGNLLTQKKTTGNGTTDFVEEIYTYDSYGNILTKTLAPSGETPRITAFEFDLSGRFIIKKTDSEGLETTYNYQNSTGYLLKETDPFGFETSFVYDSWNRLKKVTDYLGNDITTTYLKSGTDYTVTTSAEDGSLKISRYNKLQQLVEEQQKDVLGQLIKRKYEYDAFGRIKRESEPYLGGAPTQWNTTDYDRYGRLIKKTSFTGKTVNFSYGGLSVTVDDGTKVETTTKDAMGNVVKKVEVGTGEIQYKYFGNGNLKNASYEGVVMSIEQDGWGRKTKLIDPSAGTYTYEYNGYGELTKEINPKGSVVYNYDEVGRMISKEIDGDHTDMGITYDFNETTKLLDRVLLNDANGNSSQYNYTYDALRRITVEKETTPFAEFTKTYTYNSTGQVATEENQARSLLTAKSTTKKLSNTYQNGGLISISDFSTNAVLWELEALNARGQTLTTNVGNGLVKHNTFDSMGLLTEIRSVNGSSGTPVELLRLEFDFDPQRGLLNSRHNSLFNWNESFSYDSLDRLTNFNDNNGNNFHTYDARGRIIENSEIGTYAYSGDSYQQLSLTLNPSGTAYYDSLDHQDISFNAFKKPVEIEEAGIDRISFDYNAFEGRSNMFYGGIEEDRTQRRYSKHYAANGSMEIKIDKDNGKTTFVIYIGGDAYSAPVIWHSEQAGTSSKNNYYYLHRDYLGSIMAITDANGGFKEKRHFDAWGNIVKLEDGNGNSLSSFDILDRGYTGHEHLLSVGIIHMNGRLYDPILHRFLNPDNHVQDPYNTQNFNRYGYVLNNPLKYTDPSGEFIILAAIITASVAGAYFGGVAANGGNWNPTKWDWSSGSTWAGVVGGAVIGAGSAGAGIAASMVVGTAISGFATGGILGGAITGIAGGGVGGFVSGAGMSLLPGGSGKFWSDGLNGAIIGGAAGGLIGGAIGGFTTPKGHSIWTGKAFRQPIPEISTLRQSGIESNFKIQNEIDIAIPRDGQPINYKAEYFQKVNGPDGAHNWNRTTIEIVADNGKVFENVYNGRPQTLIQYSGNKFGTEGIFELIIENGAIQHQMFVPNGVINGIPNYMGASFKGLNFGKNWFNIFSTNPLIK